MSYGQLHQISLQIGRLTGLVEGLQRESVEARNGRDRLNERLDALGLQGGEIGRRLAVLEESIRPIPAMRLQIDELLGLRNMGRGALTLMTAVGSLAGIAASWLIKVALT